MSEKLPPRAKIYDEQFAPVFPAEWETQILSKYLTVKARLLDVGCGTGRHVTLFAKRGFEVTGVDLDQDLLKAARIKLEREGLYANLVVSDAQRLPFRENVFEHAISMGNVLGDVNIGRRERTSIIEEIVRTIKDNGIVIVEFVHRYWKPRDLLVWAYRYVATTAQKLFGKTVEFGDYTETIRVDEEEEELRFHAFTTKEAKKLLESKGLDAEIEKRAGRFHDWFFVIARSSRRERSR